MSTTETVNDQTQQTDDKTTQDRNWRQLEEKAKNAEANENKWRKKALETAAASAGYDITKGVTQSLIEKFEGEDVTAELFKTYAEGEGLTPHSVIQATTDAAEVVDVLDTTTNTETQVRQDTVTTPPPKKTVRDQVTEAQQSGDLAGALNAALQEDVLKHFEIPLDG